MPIKEKIEVEMLSPLMAEFIPDYSDIVDLDDAEPLEGPDCNRIIFPDQTDGL